MRLGQLKPGDRFQFAVVPNNRKKADLMVLGGKKLVGRFIKRIGWIPFCRLQDGVTTCGNRGLEVIKLPK